MTRGRNGLPDRWLDYIAIGKQINGVPIIACKVPLKEELIRNRIQDYDQWFTPDILMERVPNVGCIVDLTATNRYYNPEVFTSRGVRHEKIFCEGHVVPSKPTVQRFFQVVDDFLHSVQSRGKVLMVHCTHGLNRTGYLVSRYMVERRGLEPQAAIAAFNEARGHNIERVNYLKDLEGRKPHQHPVDGPIVIPEEEEEEEPNRSSIQVPSTKGTTICQESSRDHRVPGRRDREARDPARNMDSNRSQYHHREETDVRRANRDPNWRNREARDWDQGARWDGNNSSDSYRAHSRGYGHRSQRAGISAPRQSHRPFAGYNSRSGQHLRYDDGGQQASYDHSESWAGRPRDDRTRTDSHRRRADRDYRHEPRF